jgi:hypothetical protein
MAFVIHWEQHGVYRKYHDHVGGDELLASIQRIEADGRFDQIRYVINDFLGVAGHDVSAEKLRLIAAIDKAAALSNPNIRVAIVAASGPILALAQRYTAAVPPYPTEIFPSLAAARAWIADSPALDLPRPLLGR